MPIYTSSPGDSSIGMNVAYHELINDSSLMIDPNKDVNEVCALVLAGQRNGCIILGGGSPKNFYLQAQPTLWEVYGIPKGGNDYFIQITTDQVVWGGLSGATPAEAVSWGKVNPGVLPDTVVAYCDSTIAFPLFCEYAIGSPNGRRPRKELVHQRQRTGRRVERAKPTRRSRPGARAARQRTIEAEVGAAVWGRCRPSSRRTPNGCRRSRASTPMPTCRPVWWPIMRDRLGWDVLFVLEEKDLRRASDPTLPAGATAPPNADHARSRLPRRSPFPPAEGSGVLVVRRRTSASCRELLGRMDRVLFKSSSLTTSIPDRHCRSTAANSHAHTDWGRSLRMPGISSRCDRPSRRVARRSRGSAFRLGPEAPHPTPPAPGAS